jgi:hypothetical protein
MLSSSRGFAWGKSSSLYDRIARIHRKDRFLGTEFARFKRIRHRIRKELRVFYRFLRNAALRNLKALASPQRQLSFLKSAFRDMDVPAANINGYSGFQ